MRASLAHKFLSTLCGALLAAAIFFSLGVFNFATATPTYAVRSANACNTCHIEPVGWYESENKKERACTLDCQSCHINRSGGGLRNSAGRYYADDALPTFHFAKKPREFADVEYYRPKGDTYSGEGRYRLWEGFKGWQAGDTPVENINERYGYIKAEPRFRMGFDLRVAGFFPLGDDAAVFPMQADVHVYGAVIPDKLSIYGTVGLQGRRARTLDDGTVSTDFLELFTVRELAIEYSGIPYNGYIRAGRINKPYGWMFADHTSFVRSPLGLGQYGQIWGVEAAINPNYPFLRGAAYLQGWKDFPGEAADSGGGFSVTGGYRALGWQAGASFDVLRLIDDPITRMTVGPMWGINLYPVTLIGEFDARFDLNDQDSTTTAGVFLTQMVDAKLYRGISLKAGYHFLMRDLSDSTTAAHRLAVGPEWTVLPSIQLGAQYRANIDAARSVGHEFLLLTHVWY